MHLERLKNQLLVDFGMDLDLDIRESGLESISELDPKKLKNEKDFSEPVWPNRLDDRDHAWPFQGNDVRSKITKYALF